MNESIVWNHQTKRCETIIVTWDDICKALVNCGVIESAESPKMGDIHVDYSKKTISWEIQSE